MSSVLAGMVSEMLELAEMEMRRRQCAFDALCRTPPASTMVDPILIEQVLVNLLKERCKSR
jgi:phosphoglycerate-specific signal transduction histidine kinase